LRHILIGGNGFLGREVARQLAAEGGDVVVADLDASLAPELAGGSHRIGYMRADMTDRASLGALKLAPQDVVHHLASKLIVPNRPRLGRDAYFADCIVGGTDNVIAWMQRSGASKMVFWSSDMVYGPALTTPRTEDHPRRPYGSYGRAKVAAEDLVFGARATGLDITVLRPRLIIGPGRLGVLERLFGLIARGLPVPLIGSGTNHFQFVSAADCARGALMAVRLGCPNTELNLGSANPPVVHDLLSSLIRRAGSRSRLVRTPAAAVKGVLGLLSLLKISPLDPEQYLIADQNVVLDIRRAAQVLGWAPQDSDADMLFAAYAGFRAGPG
jgi:dTDP-glucose 4,6-dehydratase